MITNVTQGFASLDPEDQHCKLNQEQTNAYTDINCRMHKNLDLAIGNVQFLIDFMTVLYTRWRFENYKKNLHRKKTMKKLVKLCLHFKQNTFHFDEIFFMENFKTSKFQF